MPFRWFDYLNFLVCILCAFLMFSSCYYYWIFGSPCPTVCKPVFFHLHLASGLHLWKVLLASLHLHFFVPGGHQSCTWYLTSGLPNFAQLKGENHTTWFLCPKSSIACPGAKRTLSNAKLPRQSHATKPDRRVRPAARIFLCLHCNRAM